MQGGGIFPLYKKPGCFLAPLFNEGEKVRNTYSCPFFKFLLMQFFLYKKPWRFVAHLDLPQMTTNTMESNFLNELLGL